MDKTERDTFLAELTTLLKKHNVRIVAGVGDCSDTHGIYGEHIIIETDEINPTKFLEVLCWELSSETLQEEMNGN